MTPRFPSRLLRAVMVAVVCASLTVAVVATTPQRASADDFYVSDIADALAGGGDPISGIAEAIGAMIQEVWDSFWG